MKGDATYTVLRSETEGAEAEVSMLDDDVRNGRIVVVNE